MLISSINYYIVSNEDRVKNGLHFFVDKLNLKYSKTLFVNQINSITFALLF
jgi:hypothetical protein